VEPIAAVIGALAVTFFTPILPYALAFESIIRTYLLQF